MKPLKHSLVAVLLLFTGISAMAEDGGVPRLEENPNLFKDAGLSIGFGAGVIEGSDSPIRLYPGLNLSARYATTPTVNGEAFWHSQAFVFLGKLSHQIEFDFPAYELRADSNLRLGGIPIGLWSAIDIQGFPQSYNIERLFKGGVGIPPIAIEFNGRRYLMVQLAGTVGAWNTPFKSANGEEEFLSFGGQTRFIAQLKEAFIEIFATADRASGVKAFRYDAGANIEVPIGNFLELSSVSLEGRTTVILTEDEEAGIPEMTLTRTSLRLLFNGYIAD